MQSFCADAIHRAVLAHQHHDSSSWCAPLVDALESLREGSTIKWCVEVVTVLLVRSAIGSDDRTHVDLEHLIDSRASAAELHRMSREIWYACDERSDLQTATSKAYEAVACYARGDVDRYKRGIAHVVSDIVVGGVTTVDERVKHVLEAFERQCEQLRASGGNKDDRQ